MERQNCQWKERRNKKEYRIKPRGGQEYMVQVKEDAPEKGGGKKPLTREA